MSEDNSKTGNQKEIDQVLGEAYEIAVAHEVHGTVQISFMQDGVYLTVLAPRAGGKPCLPEEVVREIESRGIVDVNINAVFRAVKDMKGEPVQIALSQSEQTADARVEVEMGPKQLEAYMTIYPARGRGNPVTRQAIDKALALAGVVHGIVENNINAALSIQKTKNSLLVAQASNPVEGQAAKIDFKVRTSTIAGKPTEMVNGQTDFYNLNLITNVEPGTVLAEKIQATPGVPGYTVTGVPIPAKPGKDINLSTGKNVALSGDKCIATATQTGHVIISGNKVSVSDVYVVNGDVDFNTGNIEFHGSVVVKGGISEGFKVVAEGDVEVTKVVADGIVECGGSIKVKNGIIGRKTRIKAGGNVLTRFIENATVESAGDIIVGEAIMHSKVTAQRSVVVGGKGVIVGGIIRAGEDINCKIVGSNLATSTELEAGVIPELRIKHASLITEKQTKKADYDKMEKAVKMLAQLRQTQGELKPEQLVVLQRVSRSQNLLAEELRDLDFSLEDLEAQLKQSDNGRILVQGVVHSGVKITVGTAMVHIRDDYQYSCFSKDGADIKISPYR